ncbi:Cilia- and flagella-associated protein 298,Cilia-and flagella-associated protein 298-A,Cilia- and flagella-associated protein 298-B [Mytilus coruscus]|uniref:Cilia- and flagella-associated protein 298,Cilia-and flagella-associated protein 298-A,Cilia- and flagella-associated protein 298-B n=1 Tax=Mytilus coruscus TaxID=42192 RepID=A0A6J8EV54_MYTCO|nr:Cilia- and flagella-associated protein 298,Cilia-and flagella-associated protein 298-A,Cilia- and flagella-associated protein 298-B [Mytilus coruscus]
MVKLHIKKGDESQFLYETTVEMPVDDLAKDVSAIYNGRLKVQRLCAEMEELAKHGVTLPPNMQGLTEEQIVDLKLKDDWGEKCIPSGGWVECKDTLTIRNGRAPQKNMADLINKTIQEAKDMISKKKVQADCLVTQATVKEALDILRGAVMIVYPMGLPPHDKIKQEIENEEDLSGTQASLEVIEEENASIWFSGKEMLRGKKLRDFVGKNEKTKIIAKIQKRGQGAPGREPVVSEAEQKQMMAYYYKKQEEMKNGNMSATLLNWIQYKPFGYLKILQRS